MRSEESPIPFSRYARQQDSRTPLDGLTIMTAQCPLNMKSLPYGDTPSKPVSRLLFIFIIPIVLIPDE